MRWVWKDGLAAEPQSIDLDSAQESGGELWAMMLDTEATFDGLVRRHAADPEQVDRILTNPAVSQHGRRDEWHAGIHGRRDAAGSAR